MTDPLDLITWIQFRAAFQIAAMALLEIEGAAEDPEIVSTATDALRAMQAEVGRFDISEQSWQPGYRHHPGAAGDAVTKTMKDWLDRQIRQAGRDAQSGDGYAQILNAGRMVALAQVRAEVWKWPPVPGNGGQQHPHSTAT